MRAVRLRQAAIERARLSRAESKFRRVKGYRHMSELLKALDRLVLAKALDENRRIA
jgi:hypothetical protein